MAIFSRERHRNGDGHHFIQSIDQLAEWHMVFSLSTVVYYHYYYHYLYCNRMIRFKRQTWMSKYGTVAHVCNTCVLLAAATASRCSLCFSDSVIISFVLALIKSDPSRCSCLLRWLCCFLARQLWLHLLACLCQSLTNISFRTILFLECVLPSLHCLCVRFTIVTATCRLEDTA